LARRAINRQPSLNEERAVTRFRTLSIAGLTLALALSGSSALYAQQSASQDDPAALNLAEPDFTLVGLPTSLRLPTFKSAFRVTHRFTRPLNDGDFGDLASDLFGVDSGAQIGLEYRFGIIPNGQIGINRTSNRTIELFAQYDLLRQGKGLPVEVSALATIEGTNNFRDSYSPALGAIVSRTIGSVAALYVEPIWVNNTNALPKDLVDHNDTFIVGIGARIRVRPTVYVVGEFAPRARGNEPGVNHAAFAIEKRAGGHVFQLNFSDAFGTTLAQIARGGPVEKDWFMGFNISRKFF
jgi:hypothetical protein